jgi:hypothetical protein
LEPGETISLNLVGTYRYFTDISNFENKYIPEYTEETYGEAEVLSNSTSEEEEPD